MKISGIVLAAGSSSRMTKYKQLLNFRGKSLVKDIFDKASLLHLHEIVCVTGHLVEELQIEGSSETIKFVFNETHPLGMTNSLKCGLSHIKDTEAILVMLTDQPLITLQHYQNLIDLAKQTPQAMVATAYKDTIGVPVLFKQSLFEKIVSLDDNTPAKKLLLADAQEVATVDCKEAGIDIDTDEDYKKLIAEYGS